MIFGVQVQLQMSVWQHLKYHLSSEPEMIVPSKKTSVCPVLSCDVPYVFVCVQK